MVIMTKLIVVTPRSPSPCSPDVDDNGDDDDGNDGDDDDDIYIMMKCLCVCLSVTKNEHFLERSVCLFVVFYPHFFKSSK